jgi:hypothetical protein
MKKPKPRGIRQSKGYMPGDPHKNLSIASHGAASGAAARFYDECNEFIHMMQMSASMERVKVGNLVEDVPTVRIQPYDDPQAKPFGERATDSDGMPKELGESIVCHLLWAMQQRDGKFFRDLADMCESGHDRDPLREWLIHVHFKGGGGLVTGKQDHTYTTKEILAMMDIYKKNSGTSIISGSYDSMRKAVERACRELGIKLKPLRKK